MTTISTLAEARAIAHTLSKPSKMPGYGYSIPAITCRIGSLLRKVKGSVCSSCYALKGRYVFPNTLQAMQRRFEALTNPYWVDAMVFQINFYRKKSLFFRWHDSGDLQSEEHLQKICEIAKQTPEVRHWLPTREVQVISKFKGDIPDNLVIRISAAKTGTKLQNSRFLTSSVGYDDNETFQCEAYKRGGVCGPCRACWDPNIKNVNYPLH